MKVIQATWKGLRPLLMHSARLSDPTEPIVQAMKNITGKRKKTEADLIELARLEYLGGLYLGKDNRPVIPADNVERCIQLGAQKSKLGKDVVAASFCTDVEYPLEYSGPKDPEKLGKDPRFCLKKSVAVQRSRVMRYRPMFPAPWSITFELEYDERIINRDSLIKAMADAGALVGLGDWRPKFGRFEVEVLS